MKKIEIDGDTFAKYIETIIVRLFKLLHAMWSNGESRKYAAMELLADAVWAGVYHRVSDIDDNTFTLDQGKLRSCLEYIEALVETRIEGIIPEGQQCKALKSLANQAIWPIYEWILMGKPPRNSVGGYYG